MTLLSFERCCAEIVAQTDALRSHARGADMRARVPSCPDWNLGQLLRHLGGAHRWVETIVRTRAQEPVSDHQINDVAAYADEDPAELDAWLADGAARLAATLREAGPATAVWTVVPEQSPAFWSTAFWARRMAHETVVHRSDVALTAGAPFAVEEDVALDALDEWLGFASFPEAYESTPGKPPLLGPGRTLRFHATDTEADADPDWLIDLTGTTPRCHRDTPDTATVTARGPLTALLLHLYRRPGGAAVEILGDAALLELWLERTGFWLQ